MTIEQQAQSLKEYGVLVLENVLSELSMLAQA